MTKSDLSLPELDDIDDERLSELIDRLDQNDDAVGGALVAALTPLLAKPERMAAQLAALVAFFEGYRELPDFDLLLRVMRVGRKHSASWAFRGPRGLA